MQESTRSGGPRPGEDASAAGVEAITMPDVERLLSMSERLLYALAKWHEGDGMPVFVLRCSGPWDAVNFREALDAVQTRHPLLRSRIVEPKPRWPRFQLDVAAQQIPLEIIEAESDSAWEAVALSHSLHPLDPFQAPLCRFSVVPDPSGDGFDIVASFHHSIIDALSVLILVREVFEQMSGRSADQPVCADEYSTPSMQPNTFWQRMRTAYDFVRDVSVQSRRPCVTAPADAPSPGGIVRLVWSPERTRQLAASCRREGTTVFGALAAGAMQTLAARYGWGDAPQQIQAPIDIRGMFAPPLRHDAFGCLVAAISLRREAPLSIPFWELARLCRQELQQKIDRRTPSCLDSLTRRRRFSGRALKQPRQATLSVNNLGRCDEVRSGLWRLEEFSWYARSQRIGAATSINVATINDCLNMTLQGNRLASESLRELGSLVTERISAALHADVREPVAVGV